MASVLKATIYTQLMPFILIFKRSIRFYRCSAITLDLFIFNCFRNKLRISLHFDVATADDNSYLFAANIDTSMEKSGEA